MERSRGWDTFEETVSIVKAEVAAGRTFDRERIEEDVARAEFETARTRMYEIGAVDLMRVMIWQEEEGLPHLFL